VGSLIAAGSQQNRVGTFLGFIAVVCATSNIIGGFLITDRMLRMFRRDVPGAKRDGAQAAPSSKP
jgi:NAD(P) transhydrogenase subunit alpha